MIRLTKSHLKKLGLKEIAPGKYVQASALPHTQTIINSPLHIGYNPVLSIAGEGEQTITLPDVIIFNVTPVAKPRMTQKDKWEKRPAVIRYRDYKDQLRFQSPLNFKFPESHYHVIFGLPMPRTWSKKKKETMQGRAHQQKPDIDNLLKGIMDAFLTDDSKVWDGRCTKIWEKTGSITIKFNIRNIEE